MRVHVAGGAPRPTSGYDVYWWFASERQQVYRRRLEGYCPPLSADAVIANNRFTNPYRAADRVSQYLITEVIYDAERTWADTFARVLVFKVFNRVDTWEYLQKALGEITARVLLSGAMEEVLAPRAASGPIYSAAYIMPPPRNRPGPKFARHLSLLGQMLTDGAPERIAEAATMADAYRILLSYDSIGPFLAYQFLTDLNYSPHLDFAETEFVVPGPGALRGLRKCFTDPGDLTASDLIRWVMESQDKAFAERELPWSDLWGRSLQLIDIQNLFCEVDKYTRQAHPELSRYAPGQRIKQRYQPTGTPLTAWFPPKWGVNNAIPARFSSPRRPDGQLALFDTG